MGRTGRCFGLGAASALALALMPGCASWHGGLPGFLANRVKDGMECVDLGVTVTTESQFALYAALLSCVPLGYGHLKGSFVGVGGGDLGAMRIYYSHYGIGVYGRERTGWGNCLWDFPAFEAGVHDERMNCQGVGPLGFLLPPYDARPAGRPTCTKFFHVGYLGLIANAHFAQMADFMAGCMGLDPAGDDGRKYGLWPWQIESRPYPRGADEPAAPRQRPTEPPKEPSKDAPRQERPKPPHVEPPLKPAPKPSEWRLEQLVP